MNPTPPQGPRQMLWTPTFILFLVYAFIILTNRIPGATFVMGAALLSLPAVAHHFEICTGRIAGVLPRLA